MSRPATVKLTRDEWIALGLAVDSQWGIAKLEAIARPVLGDTRTDALKAHQSTRITKKETEAMVLAFLPLIPVTAANESELRQARIDWVTNWASPIFTPARFAEIVAYVRHRIEEYEAKPVEPPPVVVVSPDAIDATRITMIGKNKIDIVPAKVLPNVLRKADISGSNVRYDLSIPPSWWDDKNSALKGPRLHVYWPDGRGGYKGGHYEWTHYPGQPSKDLKNIRNNYLGEKPPIGSDIFFCHISHNKKERSPIVKSTTPWRG